MPGRGVDPKKRLAKPINPSQPRKEDIIDVGPTVDVPIVTPYIVGLNANLIMQAVYQLQTFGAGFNAATYPDIDAVQMAALQTASELLAAMQFEIIGADDADPDPLLAKSKVVVYPPGDSGAPAGTPPGDFVVQYHPRDTSGNAAYLTGAFTPTTPGTNYDLTALGSIDWHHFGGDESGKNTGTLGISHVSINGGQYFSNGDVSPIPFTFSWEDAPGAASGVSSGAVAYQGASLLNFSLNLVARTPYTFVIWVSAYSSTLSFLASMANHNAPDYGDASLVSSGGSHAGFYTINCKAAANTTLNFQLHGGNVQLFAIAGAAGGGPPPAPPSFSITGIDDTVVASENGGVHATLDGLGGYNIQRVAPTPAVHVSLNGTGGTITDSTEGNHRRRDIALAYSPPATPKTPPQPCNCDTGGSKPPPTPPVTPPPGIPTPAPPSKQNWSCIALIDDAGIGATVTVAGVVGVGAKFYDQNNTAIGAAITTALTAELSPALQAGDVVQSLTMRCTAVMQISPFTLFGLSDPLIVRPAIVKVDGVNTTDYYYFQRARTEAIEPGPLVHDVYDGHSEVINAIAGYSDWAFACSYIECEIARAFTNLKLELCGAVVTYWQPIFYFPFNGTEQVFGDGMHDIYSNYTVPFDVNSFLTSDGYPVNTDNVHGFHVNISPLQAAPLRVAATQAVISGHIKAVAGANDTSLQLDILVDGGGTYASSTAISLAHTDDKDFSFTIDGTFNAGTTYGFSLVSGEFPAQNYFLTNVRGAFI